MTEERDRTPQEIDRVVRLTNAILRTIDEFAETEKLTTGEAMDACFEALVAGALNSPNHDPMRLITEMDAKIREAMNLQ